GNGSQIPKHHDEHRTPKPRNNPIEVPNDRRALPTPDRRGIFSRYDRVQLGPVAILHRIPKLLALVDWMNILSEVDAAVMQRTSDEGCSTTGRAEDDDSKAVDVSHWLDLNKRSQRASPTDQ